MAKQYLSLTLVDDYNREVTKRIEIKEQLTLADYTTVGNTIINALADVTDLAIVRADLVLGDWIALADTPVAGANVDVGGTFQCELAGEANRKASHKIPGIKAAFVGAQGTIDPDQATLVTYLAQYLEANDALLSDGESVGNWIKGTLDR